MQKGIHIYGRKKKHRIIAAIHYIEVVLLSVTVCP
jgi:hypothetical protein